MPVSRPASPRLTLLAAMVLPLAGVALALVVRAPRAAPAPSTPEERAVAFLAAEVPLWPAENNCFSCHNNGDAARALYAASELGYQVPPEALTATSDWLRRPGDWDDNGGNGEFDDRTLARIQFASALAASLRAGPVAGRAPLIEAARIVAGDQQPDGFWKLDQSTSIGSPATYGPALATAVARRVLAEASPDTFAENIRRADDWLRGYEIKTVFDAATIVFGLGRAGDEAARTQRAAALELIKEGRRGDGGWGPYLIARSEPFDTALIALALGELLDRPDLAADALTEDELNEYVRGARAWLLGQQMDDGSWAETTRPPGQISYAQYISTTGWAALALLRTRDLN